jgi:phosphomannomutase
VPEISRFFGIVIQMYANDHVPPHFHATYGGFYAHIRIAPVVLLHGRLPPRVFALIVEWATLHRDELLSNWERLRQGQIPEPIAPLE